MPFDELPLIGNTEEAVVLVGRVGSAKVDLPTNSSALVMWWHHFFSYMDERAPPGSFLASRSAETFEYVLCRDTDAACAQMTNFAAELLQYGSRCGAFLRLGLAHGDCTTAFSGHVLRLCVFGSAVDNARRAADIASIGKLVVTEDIAVHITKMHTNNKRTYAVCHHTDSLYTLVDKEDTTTRGIQPFAAQHRFWLWFCNSPLEHQFTLHHNALYIGTERVWMGVGILMCAIYARRVLSEGYTDAPLMKASLAFLASEILTLFQSLLLRTWFLRHREAWATIHRLAMVIMISGASGKMQGVERLVLGYGATAMMMNAIGHKVRFHLQLVLSLITCSIGLCWMFNDHWYGGGRVSAAQPFMLVLVTVVLPGLLVWCVDRSSRRAFTACKLR